MRCRATLVAAAVLVLGAVALAQARQERLGGTLRTQITSGPTALHGTWWLTFDTSGTHYWIAKGSAKTRVVHGAASQPSAHTVTFTDQGGPYACRGAQAIGRYSWRASGTRIVFTAVKDGCAGRRLILTSRPFLPTAAAG
jgi:hypothetical protein